MEQGVRGKCLQPRGKVPATKRQCACNQASFKSSFSLEGPFSRHYNCSMKLILNIIFDQCLKNSLLLFAKCKGVPLREASICNLSTQGLSMQSAWMKASRPCEHVSHKQRCLYCIQSMLKWQDVKASKPFSQKRCL